MRSGGGRSLDLPVVVYTFAGGCMHCNGMCTDHDTLQGNLMMRDRKPEVRRLRRAGQGRRRRTPPGGSPSSGGLSGCGRDQIVAVLLACPNNTKCARIGGQSGHHSRSRPWPLAGKAVAPPFSPILPAAPPQSAPIPPHSASHPANAC